MVYTCSEILFSLEMEGNSEICYNMDEPISKISQYKKTNIAGFHLYNVLKSVKIIKLESIMVVGRD